MEFDPVLDAMEIAGHETVAFGRDSETDLSAIVAIHSTRLGPALGGVRMLPYPTEGDALVDVLRLSQGMTFKAAAAGLDLGGGKAVIIGDPTTDKTPPLLEAFGALVERLGGDYITAEDVGTTVEDLVEVAGATRWVTGLPRAMGGSGDPSPMTARGVVAAMRAVASHRWGDDDLAVRSVAVQGVGKVGSGVAALLAQAGATVTVSDVDRDRAHAVAETTGATVSEPEEILTVPCDILAPCALGAVLDDDSIRRLRCAAVVGAANNQLALPSHAEALAAAGILYAPDYVANAGGIVNISVELRDEGYDAEDAARRVDAIEATMGTVLDDAARGGVTPDAAARRRARSRLRPPQAVAS
jgi:leucine dehydrogenase